MEIEIPKDNVVEVEFGKSPEMKVEHLPQTRLNDRRFRKSECMHPKVWLDEDNHRLECQTCQDIVDPIKYLKRFADRERDLDHRVSMINEFQRREHATVNRERMKHMPRSEWKRPASEIHSEHRLNGCPKQYMWFTRSMIMCYCGIGLSRTYSKELEAEVRAARKASEQRRKLQIVGVA